MGNPMFATGTRKRHILVCFVVFAGTALAAMLLLLDTRRSSFGRKYQRLEQVARSREAFRTTKAEVESILGPPKYEESVGGGMADTICVWVEGEERIGVAFLPAGPDGEMVATRIGFLPLSPWQKFRRSVLGASDNWP
jgi:hypothetical protein